uniref:Uncharacterized protein n=1 Tax=Solibacter usitatus (strain Ellin6076) TaxID=234267 RepID=Q01X06_SOLUE
MTPAGSYCGLLPLVGAFVSAHYCRRFTSQIEHRWQALSAGVAVAYVFVNVIPELEEHRPIVAGTAMAMLLDAEKKVYLWALTGFIAFAALSRLRLIQRSSRIAYWGVMAGWGTYMLLIGYLLLHREDSTMLSLWLFAFAMGLHIFMLDTQLAERYEGVYEPWGRCLLLTCLLVGWAMGVVDALPDSLTSRLFALVAGGVIITSAHEEIAVEKSGRFWWFVCGAGVYASVLMLT